MVQLCQKLCLVVSTVFLVFSLISCGEDIAGCSTADSIDCSESETNGSSASDSSDIPSDDSDSPTDDSDPSTIDESNECDVPALSPLYDSTSVREPDVLVDTPEALVTHVADRARDRHAREDIVNGTVFRKYDHYLPFYWEQRVANLEIIDRVSKGGSGVTVNFTTLAELNPAEFRTFYGNTSSVALYHNNMSDLMNQGVTLVSTTPSLDYPGETEFAYSATVYNQFPEHRPLVVGDRIEIELSQFLLSPRNGRLNYYGTAILYVVGEGIVPWYAKEREEAVEDAQRETASFDSFPLPESSWLGGRTTLPYQYSNEPAHRFKQMAGNISPTSGYAFMHGRRLHHTDFLNGEHSESGNPVFMEQMNRAGPIAVAHSCVTCHLNNGRDVPPEVGSSMLHAVVKLSADEHGNPHPSLGDSLQPLSTLELIGVPLLRIEAEDYTSAQGISTESTTDNGGGLNVGYMDAGDRLSYANAPLLVDSPGNYVFSARVASDVGGGRMALTGPGGSPVYGIIEIPNTGGWQAWTTLSVPLTLDAGEYTFELQVEVGGWNINWFEVLMTDGPSLAEAAVILADYEFIEGEYVDGESFTLRKPVYAFQDITPDHFSVRLAPQLVGLGLLEAVDESILTSLADPCDENGDGISGKLRVLEGISNPEVLMAGRFGLKAGQPSVLYQIAAALNRDMGVTTSIYPLLDAESLEPGEVIGEPELSGDDLELMRRYVSLLGVPARRGLTNEQVIRGEQLFQEASCGSCHKATLTTGSSHPYAELREQTIHPFTDMLLHDMGAGLADSLNQPNAAAQEWRTAPLWGIGLTSGVSGSEAYLHDGRARNLAEAILWHGGEAEAAKESFRQMPGEDREALLAFLKSL